MKQQPDKLFHSTLKDFGQNPPTDLWNTIEEKMEGRRRTFVHRSIAASIIILIASGYLIFRHDDPTGSPVTKIAENSLETSVKPALPKEERSQIKQEVEPERAIKPALPTSKERAVSTQAVKSSKVIEDLNDRIENASNTAPEMVSAESNSVDTNTADNIFDHQTQLAFKASEKENITIVLTAEQTQAYLVNNDQPQATSEEKKSSTLKKLLKKAADLSSNQDPFGELRQKKNEILALNFGTEKQRGQKK